MNCKQLLLVLSAALFFSCAEESKNPGSTILNEANLLSQEFSVNIDKDTTLLTRSGCIIRIPKGSLESDSNNVKLEIREALSTTDIVLAGLTTMSGGRSLSSGGMIYFNAATGYNIKIKKEIGILVPTKKYNPDMQVFKGEKDDKGKIDWVDPIPLPKDETLEKIQVGENLFKANCGNCHKVFDDYTGPELAGITERRSKKWLYDFTRNPSGMASANTVPMDSLKTLLVDTSHEDTFVPDYYTHCLFNRWKPTIMTGFPALTDSDLDALYGYIKSETDKRPGFNPGIGKTCCDSCAIFEETITKLELKRNNLIAQNDEFFTLDRTIPITPNTGANIDTTDNSIPKTVTPNSIQATYYSINISATGWYNIDVLLESDPRCKESELFVRILGSYKVDVNVVLVIPSKKVFVEGGKLENSDQYGFYETNGKIILPQNSLCYLMAFAEYQDKILFGRMYFNSMLKQTIDISLAETSRQEMWSQIKALDLDGVKLEINDVKNIMEIRDNDQQMEAVQKLQPKNCDCGFKK